MSITKEEARKIVKFMKNKSNDKEFVKIRISVLEGEIESYPRCCHIYGYELKLKDSGYGEYSSGIEIESARIKNNKLHIVLVPEEELLIPIRDD